MRKINFKNSFLLLTAIVLISSGFFMFTGSASAAEFCSVSGDKNTSTNINGDVVYCDNNLNIWTPTANVNGSQTTYTWGSDGTIYDSNNLGASYPAANYCNTLTYAGYSDWVLPSCVSELNKTTNCQLYQFRADAGAAPSWDVNNNSSGWYWASTGIGSTAAENLNNSTGAVFSNNRSSNNNVRCVRPNPTYSVTAGTMTRISGDASSTINIDATPVIAGATVTLTVAPKTGMQLQAGTLTATYNDGSLKTLTLSGSGPYTFIMPAYAVTVTASFVIIPPTLYASPTMLGGDVRLDYYVQNNDYETALQFTGSVKVNGVSIDPSDFYVSGVIMIYASEFPTARDYTIVVSATGYADNTVTQTVLNPTITSSSYNETAGYIVLAGVDFNHSGGGINVNKLTFKGKNSQTYTLTDTTGGAASSTEAYLFLSATDKAAVNLLLDKYGNKSSDGVDYNLDAAAGWQTDYSNGAAAEDATNIITVSRSSAGTMTATTLSMKGTQTKTINPITITDVGGEIGSTNGIQILIPYDFGLLATDPAHAEWNYLNTTATITNTGTGVVSPTVSYGSGANSNVHNVLSLNVTTPFSSGDSVTISGLSIITTGETTQSHPLLWSVDGGYSFNATDSGAIMSVDNDAPTFTSSLMGPVQADGSQKVEIWTQMNEDGTTYYVVVAHGADVPSVAQVMAGHDSTGADAIDAGNAVTSNLNIFATAALGADATQYDAYVVGEDAAGNTTSVTEVNVTTPAGISINSVTLGAMTRVLGDNTSTINIDATPVTTGATVTLTVAPKAGMQLKTGTLVAAYNDGSPKTLTISGSGPYTFTMPAYPVTVTVTFGEIPPTLMADSINNVVGQRMTITVPGSDYPTAYFAALHNGDIKINGQTDMSYSYGYNGTNFISFAASYFPTAEDYTITITNVPGYADNSVIQTVLTPVLVTNILVAGQGSATSVLASSTLNMVATTSPSDATYSAITWSTTGGTGITIDQTGLLSTRSYAKGTATVTATAQDGSNVFGSTQITVTIPTCSSISNAATYNSYPTCGVATCNSGYTLSNGTCVALVGSGGNGSVFLPVTPTATTVNEVISDLTFTINNGAKTTTIPEVSLTLNADPITVRGYIVSLDNNFTDDVSISPYRASEPVTFILPSKAGFYTLYLKYYSTTGVYSKLYTQSISFQPKTIVSIPVSTPATTPTIISTTTPTTISHYLFKRTLQLGSKGSDVKTLQQFLNVNGYIITKNGAGSLGNETNFFGPATKAALIKFQKANKISPAVGYFGPVTRSIINAK